MLLFETESEPVIGPQAGRLAPDAFVPRAYQIEDIQCAQKAWGDGKRSVLYRAATGTGKATVLATIASIHRHEERTLCLINTIKLATQLRKTFAKQLGWTPGICGGGVFDGMDRRVVICVVQSLQKTGADGLNRAERVFDPTEFGTLLIDECESALADGYMAVVRHWINGNPDLHVLGCTATPIRGDGVGMGALFDHVIEEEGPLNRGPLWAFQQGWLVPPKQAFLRCSADFDSLKISRGKDGTKDYSEEQLGELLSSEQHLLEMAQGIVRTAGEDRCIVVCPNSTNTCDAIAEYINGAKPGSAMPVHGKLRDPEGVMGAHQRGEFQFLCGVNMLTTGYDDPKITKVYILRPTKSQRLFQQIIGRAFRPHDSIARQLGGLLEAAERQSLIAQSPKPHATIYCLVGISRNARDMQIADLLRGRLSDAELERVKQKMLDGAEVETGQASVVEQSVGEILKEVRKEIRDEQALAQRRRVQVERAEIQITELNDQDVHGLPGRRSGAYEVLRRMGFKDRELNKLSQTEAGLQAKRWIARANHKPPLCTHGQWRLLESRGRQRDDLETLTKKQASKEIEGIAKAERWGEKRTA